MRTYRWWRKQKKRVKNKYTCTPLGYMSPKELREWYNHWIGRK